MPLTDLAQLAELIGHMQSRFVRSAEPHRVFDGLLPDLLCLTGSEYGFIGEVWRSESGARFLKIFTMTNIAWDEASRTHVERERVNGIEFHNLKTLFGAALVTGEPVIANDAPNDPRRGGLPHGHTPLNTFLGVPLHYGGEMVGMIGVANRPAYDEALLKALDPLFQSMAGIMAAVQLERQRRAAEDALKANDARWRHSFEMAGAGVAHVDATGAFLDINARMCQITGRPREQLLRLRFQDITHPDDLGNDVAALQRLVAGESVTQSFEKRYLRPDGSSFWVQIAATPARDAQGRFLHTVAIILDIDQRRRAEQVLREREAQFTKLADRVPGVLLQFHVDLTGHASVPYVSAALRDLFELDPDGPVRDDASLMIARVVKGQRGRVWGQLEAGGRDLTPWAQEFEVDLPQRGRRWLEGRGTPERLTDGSTLWHGYIDDITERKRYEEVLVAARASRRASEAKTEFLSRMSHELRTPLNAVLGFAQLLANDPAAPLDEGQRTRLGHIERSGQHLLSMIGDVLDLSQVEAGNLALQLRPLPVTQVIEESFVLIAPAARAAGVSLLHGGTPVNAALYVRADAIRLRQALVNLLSNAVKYNRPGGQVIVDAKLVADAGRGDAERPQGLVQIAVTDTGMGLTPAQQLHLFEPFNRLGAERSQVEGTGLGLAITLRLVERMNGRIRVHSEAGRGSTFVVELPRSEPPPQDLDGPEGLDGFPSVIGPLSQSAGLPHVVLYAEDNELNVELVRQLLTLRAGCELRVARNGTEAIALARAQRPDLMLIDMHLGDMSGLDVLEALQNEPGLLGVPRIALSADALPQNIRMARERGFDEYITKPVDVAELLRCLERHLD